MDPKILTLFDDDDFQPPPPRQKNARKEKIKTETEVETEPLASMESQATHEDAYLVSPDTTPVVEPEHTEQEVNEQSGKTDIYEEDFLQSEYEVAPRDQISGDIDIKDVKEIEGQGEDAKTLDAQMRAALIQADYTQYVYKEMPAQPQQQVKGSGIVFEGVVTPKKAEQKQIVIQQAKVEEHISEEVAERVEALPEWQLESRYYSIGEVAKLFSVNTSHIRFWTTEFKLKPRTTRKGDRLYNTEDINQLRLIHHLVKEKKHTIKGAKEKLKEKDTVEGQLDLKTSLTNLKNILAEMRDKL